MSSFDVDVILMAKREDLSCPFVAPCKGNQVYTKKMQLQVYHDVIEEGVKFKEAWIAIIKFRRLFRQACKCNEKVLRARRKLPHSEWITIRTQVITSRCNLQLVRPID